MTKGFGSEKPSQVTKRQKAYFKLIKKLLNCPSGREPKIFRKHQHQIDAGLVETMEMVAKILARKGEISEAYFLRDMADWLVGELGLYRSNSVTDDPSGTANFIKPPAFLGEVLWAIAQSQSNPQIVYPLLRANLDKLNESFLHQFRRWIDFTLLSSQPKTAQVAALGIITFSTLLWEFPQGNRTINLEIAITGLEGAAKVFTRELSLEIWANIQINLAPAYRNRRLGHRADNQEKAIAACHGAMLVYTRDGSPENWARVQNNLGLIYTQRHTEDKAENLEKAIACYEEALQVITRSAFPELWGTLQNNLGLAYTGRIQGEKAQNLEQAIACYQVALQVRTRSASPYYWASSQYHLGIAYTQRILGNRTQNLERAIAAYQAALQVYTRETYPERWAATQSALGDAYRETGQITEALACFHFALEVYTPTSFPRDCIGTGLSLGDTALAAEMKAEAFEGYAVAIEAVEQSRHWANFESPGQEIPEELFAYTKMVVFCISNGERNKAREYAERSGSQRILDLLEGDEFQQIYSISQFLYQVLQATAESNGNPQAVYEILEKNLDKLDKQFVQMLQILKAVLQEITSEQAISLAATILSFSSLIQQFPQGDKAINVETATTGYEVVATVFTKEAFPEQWGFVQDRLCELFQFQILQAVFQNQDNPQAVYPLLEANKDKLDERFAAVLRDKATAILSQEEPEYAKGIAAGFIGLSLLIKEFRQGNEANNLEIAIAGYEVASTVLTREAFPEQWGVCQTMLGNAYHRRIKGGKAENLELAIAHLQNALQVRTRDDFPELWAEIQSNLVIAYGYRIRGDQLENAELAIAAGMAAMQVYTRDNFPEGWAKIQNNLGIVYRDRIEGDKAENLEQAIACYKNAFLIRTGEDFPELWAQTQMNLGSAYRYRLRGDTADNLEVAIAANQAALQVYTKEAFPQDWAGVQMNLGNAYLHRICGDRGENLEIAIAAHQAALQVFTQDKFPQKWAMTQMNLGNAYLGQGREEKAIFCYRSALKVFTPTAFPVECLNTGRLLGKTAFLVGHWAKAIAGYSVAIEAVETSRTWATSESRRLEIVTESLDIYQNLLQACIRNGQLDKAIEVVERSRSKRLVDLMVSYELYSGGEIPPELQQYLQEFETLQQQIDKERGRNNLSSHLDGNEVVYNRQNRAALQAYNETIAFLEDEKQLIWEQLRRLDPVLAGQIQVSPLNLSSIQQLIDSPTTAILSFYTTVNDTHIFVIQQSQITLHTCSGVGFDTLQAGIFTHWLGQYLENKDAWKDQFNLVTAELAQLLQLNDLITQHLQGISELIIVPHLALHLIPFAALPIKDGQYLGDKFLIRYTPSCQVLEFCQKRPSVGSHLNYGTVEDATEDLPFASFEGEQLAALYNIPENQRLKGRQQASVSNYRELVQKVQVIHSSHHAQSRLDNPLESVLILGDGCITLGQLMTPGWRLPQLSDVFLSCCETGLGFTEITDDIFTFSTAFLCAGARSVISTLWAVDDLATALFSLFYYQHRQQGDNRPEAIRQAQVDLRNLTGETLTTVYKPQLNSLLKQKLKEADALRKEAQKKRDTHLQNPQLHQQWDEEYKKRDQIGKLIYKANKNLEYFCRESKPFSDPFYWAAFTCSGWR